MGQPTPAQFMGQSLVPFLRGKTIKLTRPILAEGRLKQALVLPDGMKVVVDNQNNNVELYNLTADPGELHNLADSELLKQPLAMLRRFFEVHTRPGYKVPYR
jgi:arylsulfatase A-like enzyme